jgi:hypothetical protein
MRLRILRQGVQITDAKPLEWRVTETMITDLISNWIRGAF